MCEEKIDPTEEERLKLLKMEKAFLLEKKGTSVNGLKQMQERAKEGLLEPAKEE
jgi:hypothetical protein